MATHAADKARDLISARADGPDDRHSDLTCLFAYTIGRSVRNVRHNHDYRIRLADTILEPRRVGVGYFYLSITEAIPVVVLKPGQASNNQYSWPTPGHFGRGTRGRNHTCLL